MRSPGKLHILNVLLWHHYCFYKHRKALFVASILLPIVLMGLITALLAAIASLDSRGLVMKACVPKPKSLLSAGPWLYGLRQMCQYEPINVRETKCEGVKSEVKFVNFPKLRNDSESCRHHDSSYRFDNLCKYVYNYSNDMTSARAMQAQILRGNLAYYPKSEAAEAIMTKFRKRLEEYGEFFVHGFGKPTVTAAVSSQEDDTLRKSMDPLTESNSVKCLGTPADRIVAVDTLEEALSFLRSRNRTLPMLGILHFSKLPRHLDGNGIDYEIIYDKENPKGLDDRSILLLQGIVEESMISHYAKVSHKQLWDIHVQGLPNKCWKRPFADMFSAVFVLLPFAVVYGFILVPIYAMDQMIVEKTYGLREYIGLIGVSNAMIKFSWWLFYILFLWPLSAIVSAVVPFFPTKVMAHTPYISIFFLIALFNTAQLSLAFLWASILNSIKQTSNIFCALHSIMWILLTFLMGDLAVVNSGLAIGVHVLSLYCVTPLVVGCKYLSSWEEHWLGVNSKLLFQSPLLTDDYGGFGVCLIWLAVDALLYMLLALYIEKVFPGDFGISHHPLFFLGYEKWCSKKDKAGQQGGGGENKEADTGRKADVEMVHASMTTGLETQGLRKVYANGYVGLHDLSIAFYASEVTCFLGQNGAGKSTTINSIVGMIDPSKGRILFNGVEQASKNSLGSNTGIGFMPQHDILYPALTVKEHLIFYGGILGMTKQEISNTTSVLLKDLGLNESDMHTRAIALSGGQKRKLSLAVTYMSNPSIVILDEPTSGVDPFSRRAMWDLILKFRSRTTTVLSTHQMHEADILSDRIAIISGGRLSCYGTPLYLKKNYGEGSQVTVVMPKSTEESTGISTAILSFVRQYFSAATFKRQDKCEYSFTVPTEESRSEKLVQFLEKLDQEKEKLGYESYGVSESTMEHVFFAASGFKVDKIKAGNGAPGVSTKETVDPVGTEAPYKSGSGLTRWLLQATGVLIKKVLFNIRSFSSLIYQFLLPLMFVLLLVMFSNQKSSGSSSSSNIVHLWNGYRQNLLFVHATRLNQDSSKIINSLLRRGPGTRCTSQGVPGYGCAAISETPPDLDPSSNKDTTTRHRIFICASESCRHFCKNSSYISSFSNTKVPSSDRVYRLRKSEETIAWIFAANDSSQEVIGGYDLIEDITLNKIKKGLTSLIQEAQKRKDVSKLIRKSIKTRRVVIWTKPSLAYGMLNGFNNVLLRSYSSVDKEASIRLSFRAASFDALTARNRGNVLETLISVPFLVLAFMFTSYSVTYLIMHEKSTGLKRLQRIASVSGPIYWTVNLICDFATFSVSLGLICLLLAVVSTPFKANVGFLIAVMIPYGFATITFIYMFSFWFKTATGLTQLVLISTVIFMLVSLFLAVFSLTYRICQPPLRPCNGAWAVTVSDILRFIPASYLSDTLLLILFSDPSGSFSRFNGKISSNRLSMDFLGKSMVQGVVAGIFYFLVVLILERFNVECSCNCKCCCCRTRSPPLRLYNLGQKDPDVAAEEAKVMSQACGTDVLEVRQLKKFYPGTSAPAVNRVSFTVPQSQCFGLLGINGAGKSTTFRMLTGYLSPTEGNALIGGKDPYECRKIYSCHFGYCPQEDVLFDVLTVKQHLEIFTRLRGVPGSARTALIESLIKQVGLTEYVKKKAKQLSGGNKRKLQVALSLIDYPPLIFMDEPTTGMDPGARRMVWDAITRATRHKSAVVLTSHIMEECEVLCNRLVIMVCGQFHCIGGVQYLKNKYGNQYIVKLRLKPPPGVSTAPEGTKVSVDPSQARGEQVTLIKNNIISEYPSARLIEEHTTLIQYNIPTENLKLAKLFRKLYDMRSQHQFLDDYSISQVSLEHVFVEMAQKQELMMANQENWA